MESTRKESTLENSETMTPGQMRQMMNAVNSTIPADLSQAEVNRMLKGPRMRRYLETFWEAMRADEDKGLYVRLPKGDVIEYIRQEKYFLGYDSGIPENDEEFRELLKDFTYSGNRSRHGSWVKVMKFEDECPNGMWRYLRRNGFRTADFRELVGYMEMNPDEQVHIIASSTCEDYDAMGAMGYYRNGDYARTDIYRIPEEENMGWFGPGNRFKLLVVKL